MMVDYMVKHHLFCEETHVQMWDKKENDNRKAKSDPFRLLEASQLDICTKPCTIILQIYQHTVSALGQMVRIMHTYDSYYDLNYR